MKRIAILDDYQGVALSLGPWDLLQGRCDIQVFRNHIESEDELVAQLAGFDVLVANRERTAFPRSVLERLPQLRLIATSGKRNASIDIAAARDVGIVVSGTDTLGYPTVELTWALILALFRGLVAEVNAVREGGWQQTIGTGLNGKVLGVVGLGRLGSAVAQIGKAFGMQVLGCSRSLTAAQAEAVGVQAVSFEELLQRSDVVTLHVPLNRQSVHLVGAAQLKQMKPSAVLVNTARGQVIDEAALVDALRIGAIRGAALDVYNEEPLPAGHPLRSCPNVLLSPHLGYVVEENYRVAFEQSVENICAWLDGQPIRVIEAPATPA